VSGSGQYLPDVTEGVTRFEDLPKAKIIRRSRNFAHIHDRIALDMIRDSQKEGRTKTIKVLHKARAG